jgi:hypothetical protein
MTVIWQNKRYSNSVRYLGFCFAILLSCQSVPKDSLSTAIDIPTSLETRTLLERHINKWLVLNQFPGPTNGYLSYVQLFEDLKKIGFYSANLTYDDIGKQQAFSRTIEFATALKPKLTICVDGAILKYEFERTEKLKIAKIVEERPSGLHKMVSRIIYSNSEQLDNITADRLAKKKWYCDYQTPKYLEAIEQGHFVRKDRVLASSENSELSEKLFEALKKVGLFHPSLVYQPDLLSFSAQATNAQLLITTPRGPIAYDFIVDGYEFHLLRRFSCGTP